MRKWGFKLGLSFNLGLKLKAFGFGVFSLWLISSSVLASAEVETAETETAGTEAASTETAAKPSGPQELVSQTTQVLLARINELKASEQEVPSSAYEQLVAEELGPVVDFDLIAKRVMSRYFKMASKDQVAQFSQVFKESLLAVYAKGMVVYSDHKIEILPFEGVRESKKSGRLRATVAMQVHGGDGKVYPLNYAMYKNNAGEWKLENLILNGVNVGLTFRNQFNEAMRKNQGSIDKVISGWNTSTDTAESPAEPASVS